MINIFQNPSLLFGITFFSLTLRYFIIAGIAFVIFYVIFKKAFRKKKLQTRKALKEDIKREISYSIKTFLIYTIIIVILYSTPLIDYTQVYFDIVEYPFGYMILSFISIVLFHDAYFYWSHRFLHSKILIKFHKIHHLSHAPTPWASFSFHPIEAVITILGGILAMFLFPIHPIIFVLFLFFMTVYNVYGHLGYELFSKKESKNILLKLLNKAIFHDIHHQQSNKNFGLYFTFWDKVMGTFEPESKLKN